MNEVNIKTSRPEANAEGQVSFNERSEYKNFAS